MPVPYQEPKNTISVEDRTPTEPELMRLLRMGFKNPNEALGAWNDYLSQRYGGKDPQPLEPAPIEPVTTPFPGKFPEFDAGNATIARCVSVYLMSSYLYYYHNFSVITDTQYDQCCERLKACLSTIEHPHRHLLDWGALDAHTGYHIDHDAYHTITKRAAEAWKAQRIQERLETSKAI